MEWVNEDGTVCDPQPDDICGFCGLPGAAAAVHETVDVGGQVVANTAFRCAMRLADNCKAENLECYVEIERLRKIEAAAVACNDSPEWSGESFYDSLLDLGKALRGEIVADKTADDAQACAQANLDAMVLRDTEC